MKIKFYNIVYNILFNLNKRENYEKSSIKEALTYNFIPDENNGKGYLVIEDNHAILKIIRKDIKIPKVQRDKIKKYIY